MNESTTRVQRAPYPLRGGAVQQGKSTSPADCTEIATGPDYLKVTFPASVGLLRVQALFGGIAGWEELPYAFRHYHKTYRCGEVHVSAEGVYANNRETILVEAKGKGCRQLEADGVIGDGWPSFLRDVDRLGGKVVRLDVAFDDFAGRLSLDEVWRKRPEGSGGAGECVTHFRRWSRRQTDVDGEQAEDSIWCGDVTSEVSVCFYDKRLEQGLGTSGLPWVRTELRAFRDKAAYLAARIISAQHVALPAAEALASVLDFKDPSLTDSNDRRWRRATWWHQLLNGAEASSLALPMREPAIAERLEYAVRSCAALLSALEEASGGRVNVWGLARILGGMRAKNSERWRKFVARYSRCAYEELRACIELNGWDKTPDGADRMLFREVRADERNGGRSAVRWAADPLLRLAASS